MRTLWTGLAGWAARALPVLCAGALLLQVLPLAAVYHAATGTAHHCAHGAARPCDDASCRCPHCLRHGRHARDHQAPDEPHSASPHAADAPAHPTFRTCGMDGHDAALVVALVKGLTPGRVLSTPPVPRSASSYPAGFLRLTSQRAGADIFHPPWASRIS